MKTATIHVRGDSTFLNVGSSATDQSGDGCKVFQNETGVQVILTKLGHGCLRSGFAKWVVSGGSDLVPQVRVVISC